MKITYTSIDGVRKTRSFKTLNAARKFAYDCVGPQDVEGGSYAVSFDGIGKITWTDVLRAALFGGDAPSPVELNKETTFYSRGNQLFCREAGYTFDHEGQLFGHLVERVDLATCEPEGFYLRGVDQRGLFNEEQVYATRDAALAAAKQAMLEYLAYRDAE